MYKQIFSKLNGKAPFAVEGRLTDYENAQTLGLKMPVIIQISQPETRWAKTVDNIEEPFAPDYNQEEYRKNPALTAMGLFELMDMLEAFGVPRRRQTDFRNRPLSGKNFIVAGCGTGREVIALATLGANVTGFDATLPYVNTANQRVVDAEEAIGSKLNTQLYQCPAEVFPYGLFKPDGITSLFGVINHVEEWEQTLKEMSEGLSSGGSLVIEKYGPDSALVFKEINSGLSYQPSILQRRTEGGILLGDNANKVLPAVFPDDNDFSEALKKAGFTITGKRGYLGLTALYPKDPTAENLAAFIANTRRLDADAADFIAKFEDPKDMLYAAMLKDSRPRRQRNLDNFAYALYVCRKI